MDNNSSLGQTDGDGGTLGVVNLATVVVVEVEPRCVQKVILGDRDETPSVWLPVLERWVALEKGSVAAAAEDK